MVLLVRYGKTRVSPLGQLIYIYQFEAEYEIFDKQVKALRKWQMPNYRPQTKLREGYVFTGVCHSVNRGEYLGSYPPWDQVPPGTRYTPRDQVHPPGPGTSPDQVHPLLQRRACWQIRSMRGRYASYWNAILSYFAN